MRPRMQIMDILKLSLLVFLGVYLDSIIWLHIICEISLRHLDSLSNYLFLYMFAMQFRLQTFLDQPATSSINTIN
jgi:hypothetical protein